MARTEDAKFGRLRPHRVRHERSVRSVQRMGGASDRHRSVIVYPTRWFIPMLAVDRGASRAELAPSVAGHGQD